ncbi:hypothetical protein OAS19_02670 [Altererythrobacter sp.]|nr:hypothetical protein [Altererythrobacter sp.]
MTDRRIAQDALNIRKHIREAEAVTDEAMLACAKLKQIMLTARQNPDINVDAGQKALMRLMQAEQQALAMSTNLLRVHQELNQIGVEHMGGDEAPVTPVSASAVEQATPVAQIA